MVALTARTELGVFSEDKEESQEGQDGQVHETTQRGNLVQNNQTKVVEISRSGIGAATGSNSNRIPLSKLRF